MEYKKDLVLGILLFVISLTIICYSYSFTKPFYIVKYADVGLYIRMWAIFLSILSTFLILNALLAKKKSINNEKYISKSNFKNTTYFSIVVLTFLMGLYILSMEYVGFTISTAFFLFTTISYYDFFLINYEQKQNKMLTKLLKYAIFSIFFSLILRYIFVNILKIILPRGYF
jgi:hypothetical protein